MHEPVTCLWMGILHRHDYSRASGLSPLPLQAPAVEVHHAHLKAAPYYSNSPLLHTHHHKRRWLVGGTRADSGCDEYR